MYNTCSIISTVLHISVHRKHNVCWEHGTIFIMLIKFFIFGQICQIDAAFSGVFKK